MDSSRLQPLVGRLAVLFVAGAAAQLAWRAEYVASFALCLGMATWAITRIVSEASAGRSQHSHAHALAWSALLERESEARRLTAFLDHAPVPLMAMRSRGALEAINLSARRMFGADDVLAAPPPQLMAAVLGALPGVRQTLTLDLHGAPRTYAMTVAEVVSEGDFVRIVALVDIQAEIQAAEAAALRELMQILSHEIMNSLTPVTSLAQSTATLLREAEDGDLSAMSRAQEAADGIARRSEGLLRFVSAYRALARLPEPRLASVDLSQLINELALLFRSRWGPGVDLTVDVDPTPPAMLDRDLMFHALLNVLTNAAEVERADRRKPSVVLSVKKTPTGRVSISVADNGVGIDLPDPQVVLKPFFTTKPQGTGVGLSVARQVALAHGGEIFVATGPHGSVFTLAI